MASTKKTLRLAYRTFVGFERALTRQTRAFQELHPDVDVELVPYDVPELHAEMVAGDGTTSGDWDLFLCVTDWLPSLVADGKLAELDAFLDLSAPPEDWPQGWSDSLLRQASDERGRFYGIPYHDGPQMFMYRADLFEDPHEQERFEQEHGYPLAPPETWSQFRDVAQFFTRPERDLSGCVVAAMADGHNSVYDFFIHLWSRGGHVLDGRKAAFNGAEGREALTYLTGLIQDRLTQPDPRAYESVLSGEYYAGGRGAMMWNWAGFAVVADMPDSNIHGKNKLGLIPRGDGPGGRHVSLSVFWALTIPKGSREPQLAWDFIRTAASREQDLVTSDEGNIGCRLSTWRDPGMQERFPCYALIEETHRTVETLPPIPEYDAINEILNELIDEVHTGEKRVDEALDEAAARTDELLAGAPAR
ncbi:MAG: extracellular solute-binding protein [Actinobacteria bacterium]|nr:MAG: extracellular solute-binding protein [Actinomycetota bacterium]